MMSTLNSWFHLHPRQWLALGQGCPLLSMWDTHNLLWATWLFPFEACALKVGDKHRGSGILIILGTRRAASSFCEGRQVVAVNTHPCAAIPPLVKQGIQHLFTLLWCCEGNCSLDRRIPQATPQQQRCWFTRQEKYFPLRTAIVLAECSLKIHDLFGLLNSCTKAVKFLSVKLWME